MEIARKLHTDGRVNWVEALPRIISKIHDIPGEAGMSPYEIVFGRERFTANVPYRPPRECEDAMYFFGRMQYIDQHVADVGQHSCLRDDRDEVVLLLPPIGRALQNNHRALP